MQSVACGVGVRGYIVQWLTWGMLPLLPPLRKIGLEYHVAHWKDILPTIFADHALLTIVCQPFVYDAQNWALRIFSNHFDARRLEEIWNGPRPQEGRLNTKSPSRHVTDN